MQSPFKIFRKHQKVALAAVTLMAMIAFGLGDVIRQMSGPSSTQREGKVVFETNIGNLTEVTIHRMAAERRIVHRFIADAFMAANTKLGSPQITNMVVQQFGFGGLSESDMLNKWLYRHEANVLGVAISDSQIQEYIDNIALNGLSWTFGPRFGGMSGMGGKKLTGKQFQEIVRELQISSKQLYDLLREELEVQTARRLTIPSPLPSPEKYWEYFQQLNTREKIAVAAIPVNSFLDKTGEPSDADVSKLFAKYQYEGESAFNGEFRPGFRQPPKVKLQYLEIAYATAEEKVRAGSPITDKEIEEYYDDKKATTFWLQEPPPPPSDDKSPIDPEITPEDGEKAPEKEGDKGPSLDQPKTEEKPADDAAKPPEKDGDSKESDVKKDAAKADEKSPECFVTAEGDDEKAPPSEKPATVKEEGAESEDAAGDDAKPETKEGAAVKTDAPKITPPPEIKFKPLDDDIRKRIRESLIDERIKKLMKDTAENARKAMGTVAEKFAESADIKLVDPDEQQLALLEKRAAEELKKIGEKFGMKFGETGLVSMIELSETPDIGKAYDPDSQVNLRGESTTIIEQAFSADGLCQVFESETLSTARFVCWKVRDVPAHVPELKDPGIREQVVAAWKRLEAQPLALKRADDLAQRARSSDKDFEAALADATVTGTSVGASLAISTSGEFSFWQEPTVANPMARSRQVQLGNPGGVTNPGRQFMQVVFEKLSDGEVGVALNDDASVYYVVKVLERRLADREEFKDAKLFDQNSAYASIAQHEFQYTMHEHNERVREKYAIRLKELPQRRGQSMALYEDE
ncbi:MAG TPA: hypothetical protein VGM05_16025 [Planctomycetaceae bacterium]|jgi:hypothetical protein